MATDEERLARLRRLAFELDESIRVPGTQYRIGYDAVIGLLPGLGDAAGLLLSAFVVVEAARFRVPKATLLRMIANVVLEAIVGAVPLLGDLFDAAFKANMRNLRLLEERLERRGTPPTEDRLFLLALVSGPVLISIGLLALVAYLISLI